MNVTIRVRPSRWRLAAFRASMWLASCSLGLFARAWSVGIGVLLPGTRLELELRVDWSETRIRGCKVDRRADGVRK